MLRRSATWFAVLSALAGAALPLGVAALGASGCGDDVTVPEEDAAAPDGGKDAGPTNMVTLHPDAAALPGETECKVVVSTGIPVKAAAHLPVCTPIAYGTNPPSGGDHWPAWANYAEYTAPVPREMYTHNLEHGGVVITYRCKDACADVKAALEDAFKSAIDPYCITNGPVQTRAVLTPDPDIPTPIAASAWGATYTATCIDLPSLTKFIADRLGRGTEMVCGNGYDPATTVMACKDGG